MSLDFPGRRATMGGMSERTSPLQVFVAFLRLGLTSFGGPVAHIGYFRTEFVARREWLDDRAYADLVALCQFLPGPTSSQTGIGIGLMRAGLPGAVAAFTGFTLPSAVLMTLLGLGVAAQGDALPPGLLHGLKVVAVAVVAQAVWGMARNLCPDAPRATVAVLAAVGVIAVPTPLGQVGVIVLGGLIGWWLLKSHDAPAEGPSLRVPIGPRVAAAALALFAALLIGLPVLAAALPAQGLALVDAFYRAGALVFGGGHVVLPLIESQVVDPGWVDRETFLAGYGAAQAVPGPMFTLASFLGAAAEPAPNGLLGAILATGAIFVGAFLLVVGGLPFWARLSRATVMRKMLTGINAAVVGLLLAAFHDPVWTSAIESPSDFALALVALVLLVAWKTPPWLVVIVTALGGWGVAAAGGMGL